ncbi:MAG: hypothetical protein DM484_07805 [Candidatus Methylumidiphilus alinenensis]|uniref:Uncharacterized protein n=1 Tax=Candidatus Methylumidiphilus alinenensis TaxID=2202197 RepID=A0A2W4RFW5_9GAMM|nr:MAG: hypothetical protein DM484_07805 [Candidatus Methylumidiphilus alinenensis]
MGYKHGDIIIIYSLLCQYYKYNIHAYILSVFPVLVILINDLSEIGGEDPSGSVDAPVTGETNQSTRYTPFGLSLSVHLAYSV